jgi:hypothetical protein
MVLDEEPFRVILDRMGDLQTHMWSGALERWLSFLCFAEEEHYLEATKMFQSSTFDERLAPLVTVITRICSSSLWFLPPPQHTQSGLQTCFPQQRILGMSVP